MPVRSRSFQPFQKQRRTMSDAVRSVFSSLRNQNRKNSKNKLSIYVHRGDLISISLSNTIADCFDFVTMRHVVSIQLAFLFLLRLRLENFHRFLKLPQAHQCRHNCETVFKTLGKFISTSYSSKSEESFQNIWLINLLTLCSLRQKKIFSDLPTKDCFLL